MAFCKLKDVSDAITNDIVLPMRMLCQGATDGYKLMRRRNPPKNPKP